MADEALLKLNYTTGGNFMQRSSCFKTSFYRNMQASGPYRYTAAFDKAFSNALIDDKVLFFSQPIVMRA